MDAHDRLDGWKAIANYLGKSLRTAHRYHDMLGLPIHHLQRHRGGSVYAYKHEVDAWLASRDPKALADNRPDTSGESRPPRARLPRAFSISLLLIACFISATLIAALLLNRWSSSGGGAVDGPGGSESTTTVDPGAASSTYAMPPAIMKASSEHLAGVDAAQLSVKRSVLTVDVIAHWKFDEAAGDEVVDSSGNQNHGEIFGAERVAGLSGGALFFDGEDAMVIVPHADQQNLIGDFTIEAVIRATEVPGPGFPTIVAKNTPASTGEGYSLYVTPDREQTGFHAYQHRCRTPRLSLNEWHHVVYQVHGDMCRAYADGLFQAEEKRTITTRASPRFMEIGGGVGDVHKSFHGEIDEIRVSRGALDQADFLPFCSRGVVRVIYPSNQIVQYATIQEAVDSSASGALVDVGSGVFPELITVERKRALMISTRCDATVRGFILTGNNAVSIRGFRIDASGTQREGVELLGGTEQNTETSLVDNVIYGADDGHSGISVGAGNLITVIRGNEIHDNGGNGVAFVGETGGHHRLVDNLIQGNGWNGVSISGLHEVLLNNNVIMGNGAIPDPESGGYGISRERMVEPTRPDLLTLVNNIVIANRGRLSDGQCSIDLANYDQLLDPFDSGNQTTCGCEGEQ